MAQNDKQNMGSFDNSNDLR